MILRFRTDKSGQINSVEPDQTDRVNSLIGSTMFAILSVF